MTYLPVSRRSLLAAAMGVALVASAGAQAQQKKHDPVTFISGSTTGTWFPTAAVIADLTNAHYDGQPISVVPGTGAVGNPLSVGTGKSEIGISNAPFLVAAQSGGNELYKQAFPDIRSVFAGPSTAQHLVMADDFDINVLKTAKDKKPKLRVGSGEKGSANQFSFEVLLAHYGVTFDDIEKWGGVVSRTGSTGAADAYNNRQLDMVNIFINHPNAKLAEMMQARPSKLVTLPEDARAALQKKWGFEPHTIPANTYPNQAQPVQTLALPLVVFATAKVDEQMIYNMTKSVAENRDRMVKGQAAFAEWKPEDMPKGLGVAMHPGAARYYKERGWVK